MKQVQVQIQGEILVVEYSSKQYEDFYDNYYMTLGWNRIDSITVGDVDITKKKGKYIKTKKYFHDLFAEDGTHPLPVEVHARTFDNGDTFTYMIKLDDNEEFDPKLFQLVKSDYEFDGMPYFILVEYVMYNGKEIQVYEQDDYVDYGIEGRYCDEWTVDELYD